MSCKLSDKCDNVFACNILRPNVELLGCNFYKPKKPMTNEEWFCGLSTEEKAEWLSKHFHCGDCIFEKPMCGGEYDGCKSAFVEWLKEIHNEQSS